MGVPGGVRRVSPRRRNPRSTRWSDVLLRGHRGRDARSVGPKDHRGHGRARASASPGAGFGGVPATDAGTVGGVSCWSRPAKTSSICCSLIPNSSTRCADRSLIPQAIEEGLRYESPVLLTPRVTTRPTELSGVAIPQSAVVTAMVASANRDPEVYDNPDTFDIFRDAHQHMSFGTGPHLCLGMHLARLETRVALNALFDRLPCLRLDQKTAENLDAHIQGDSPFRNPTCLPVMWDQS